MMTRIFTLATLVAMSFMAAGAVGKVVAPPPAAHVGPPKPLTPLTIFSPENFKPGLYQIQVQDRTAKAPTLVCVSEAARLVRLYHAGTAGCSHLTVENLPDRATVHYSCPAGQWGRTILRAVEPGLLRIETQGIASGAPFDDIVTAHRTGSCPQH